MPALAIHFHITPQEQWILVPGSVIPHLPEATELELKVLLTLLHGGRELTDSAVLQALSITEGQLQTAVEVWISRGVLRLQEQWVTLAPPPPALAQERTAAPVQLRRPSYDMAHIEQRLEQNQALRDVLRQAPALLGELGQSAFEVLYSLHDYYGLTSEAIFLLFAHCAETGRTSLRAVEETAARWHRQGATTGQEAAKLLADARRKSGAEAMVRRAFGIGDRKLTPKEKQFVATWVELWGFDQPMLELVYNRCVDQTGKLSFSYIGRILESWQLKGIRTAEQAEQEQLPARRAPKKKSADTASPPSYDIAQFEAWSFSRITDQQPGGEQPCDTEEN